MGESLVDVLKMVIWIGVVMAIDFCLIVLIFQRETSEGPHWRLTTSSRTLCVLIEQTCSVGCLSSLLPQERRRGRRQMPDLHQYMRYPLGCWQQYLQASS